MIDLSTWNLTIPSDPRPTEITTQQLQNGYQSRYFKRDGDSVVFWVPVNGSHTEDSTFPRTELRETKRDGSLYNWYYSGGDNELRATLSVGRVPSQNKIIIGQIHSKSPTSGDGEPLVKLQYHYHPDTQTGSIEALVRNHPDDSASKNIPLLKDVHLNERVTYSLRVTSTGQLGLRAESSDGEKQYYRQALSSTWSKQLLYFKAGAYISDNKGPDDEGGRVTFYHINLAH